MEAGLFVTKTERIGAITSKKLEIFIGSASVLKTGTNSR